MKLASTINFSGLHPYDQAKFDGFDNKAANQYALPITEVRAREMRTIKEEMVHADDAHKYIRALRHFERITYLVHEYLSSDLASGGDCFNIILITTCVLARIPNVPYLGYSP